MNIETNIARFESELAKVNRPGMDKLLAYVRKSDFYKAPASTKFHLSCEGGLLQHSLNVLDAMRGLLVPVLPEENREWAYTVADKDVARIPDDSMILTALLHDICKTYFYNTSTRNVKNKQTGKWEEVPYYTVSDKMPLGHGAKSAMIIKQYIELTTPEMYAIWWHMGFTDTQDARTLGQAIDQFPIIWALHTADMMASHFMEADKDNRDIFIATTGNAAEFADAPTLDDGSEFQEAIAYGTY
jgi:hypothetical protein